MSTEIGFGIVGAGMVARYHARAIAGHTLIVQDLVAAIREGRDPLVEGVEGRRSLALVLAIYEAAGLGGGSYPWTETTPRS